MSKHTDKERELKNLGEEYSASEQKIRAKYADRPKGFRVIPELLELEREFKKKYSDICKKYQ